MKKLIYCAAALATALFAGSCQQELLETTGSETTVTYSVELPGAVTKAGETADGKIGDGSNVTELVYELWLVGNDEAITSSSTRLFHKTTPMLKRESDGKRHASVTLNLVQDQKYRVLFWAQVGGKEIYVTDNLTAVTYKNDLAKGYNANQEDYAAFYATEVISTVTPPKSKTIELKRPFAQLNIGTENTLQSEDEYTINMNKSYVQVTGIPTTFDVATSLTSNPTATITFNEFTVPSETLTVNEKPYEYVAMNYVFASAKGIAATVEYNIYATLNPTANGSSNVDITVNNTIDFVPLKENYRTNIVGNLLSSSTQYDIVVDANFNDEDLDGGKFGVIDGQQYIKVENSAEFTEAVANENVDIIILEGDINLNDIVTRSATDVTLTVNAGRTLTLDLNGKTLSGTSAQSGKNYNMFDVRGTLTVKNGTIEYEHLGENMGWNSSTNIFNVTAGGVLNLEGVTAKNLGGSDMGFVAHLNNWGEVTLNAENCTLESNYVAVRVFNSGYDMNNVTIKNSTLKGNSAAFWVHNYTVEDFGSAEKAEAQKALLNLNIYNQGNTFSPDLNGVRYGFTNSVRSDAYGITKTVSEDGTVVTLGSVVDNGLVRRGVAGAEENTTITKAIVGEGITTLYDRTFRRFYALETVELPDGLTTIGAAGSGVFQSCGALYDIVIPESVTVLGEGTFKECSALESINIPAGITSINKDTFNASGIKSIEFHEGVTYFGAQAFRDCKQLKQVIINAPEFTIEPNAFGIMSGALPGTTIYVANAEMKAYLESTLAYANQFKIVATNVVSGKADLMATLEAAVANGETDIVIDAEGAEFDMNYGLSQDNVPAGTTVTIRNANVNDQSYGNAVNGTVIFEDCIFNNPSGAYSIHFDAGSGDVIFKNCDLYGWNSFGSTLNSVSFENCTLNGNGKYALIRSYVALTMKNCTINTSNADHTDKYSEGVEAVEGATLTGENISYVVYDETSLQYALNNAAVSTIYLNPREEAYIADIYNGTPARKSLTIIGSEGTKFGHTATTGGQLRLDLFDRFTISNCEIIQRSGVKTWGHLVFSASGKENGVYTIKNCTFNSNGNQGIYINETTSGAVYNIENCTFNGDFGSADGAVTIQNNRGVAFTVNVTGCTFNTDSKKVCYLYDDPAFKLNTDPTVTPVCLNR